MKYIRVGRGEHDWVTINNQEVDKVFDYPDCRLFCLVNGELYEYYYGGNEGESYIKKLHEVSEIYLREKMSDL